LLRCAVGRTRLLVISRTRCSPSRKQLSAMTAYRLVARGPRAASGERADEQTCLDYRVPDRWSHRANGYRHRESSPGQSSGNDHPRRTPTRLARPRGRPALMRGAGYRLQPRSEGTQPAHCPPGRLGPDGHQPRHGQRVWGGQPGPDPLQAVWGRLNRVGCSMQRPAQQVLKVTIVLAHASPASMARKADMARDT
jgi:hypothetical protein